jgi:hypothetical protein
MAKGRGGNKGHSHSRSHANSHSRSHAHSHSHSHHNHHIGHSRRGGGGSSNAAAVYEASIDSMVSYPAPPTLINGIYTFVGNEMSFRAQVEGGIAGAPQPMQQLNLTQQDMLPVMMPPPNMMQEAFMGGMPMIPGDIPMQSMMASQGNEHAIQQADITLVGTKSKPGNVWCYMFTMLGASCLIFPFFFMCCMWWKKIVYPAYELSNEAYQTLANFITRAQNITNLNLTIVDNAFGGQKARVVHDILTRSRITGFTFNNLTLNCNGQYNEADDFQTNMAGIKSLGISTSITWGDMIV